MSIDRRLELHDIFVNLLGSTNVYFQPPSNVLMVYPCIIYHRNDMETYHANNGLYKKVDSYQATVIDKNPDSEIPDRMIALPYARFDRHYTADNLNHDVFNIFY